MRHGKAQRFDGIEDYDRPLKKKGKLAARRIGEWLKENSFHPELVISSPAARALATAKIVCSELEIDSDSIVQDKRLYDEGLVRVKAVLADCPDQYRKVLVVGHNPELESLLYYLVESADLPEADKLLPTAGLARLRMPDNWSQLSSSCAELLTITYPRTLINNDLED